MSTKERESSGSGQRDAGPPSYVARPPDLTEHRYQLEDSKGRPWLWLTVKSRSREARQLPLFFDRDTITGTVEADLDKAEGSKGVLISVVAAVTAVGQEEIRFLDVSAELWNAKSAPSKLTGKQTWPFSITLPAECVNPERGKSKQLQEVYSLPPTFSERASPAYIDYKLVATVRKGSFRVNQTLATSIVYLPMVRAESPSPLRQLAYREGSGLVGPDGDPDGWKVLTPVTVMGTIFGARQVELQCTVAVAKPLIYALGSPIPIIVTLRGSDEQALDVLATPSSVRMHLLRVRLVGSHAVQEESTGRSNNVFREIVGTAFFWPSDEGAPQPGVRVLQGELEVKKSLKLGFVFPRFSLRYMLALLPFRAPGFAPAVSAGPDSDALLTERVSIASVNAPGVVPRSYAPPGYVFPEEGDYNTAVGYLENGNQR
ncbi:hypothetical protein BN946_scf184720.g4 [Trametes cinnabarina]|uniref:Arrestin-like N-terminal domain-containing protein n=1 Tax=Pycnoporus cinnabarinus TaxID=5643 RepID=A0A060SU97_PYCCI|nr:hypothetical protein BN946_scf184720.g4 [Trametes cinnabarina]